MKNNFSYPKMDVGIPSVSFSLPIENLPARQVQRPSPKAGMKTRARLGLSCAIVLAGFVAASPAADLAVLRTLDPATEHGAWENSIATELRLASPEARTQIEEELVSVAVDVNATVSGRREACRLLYLCLSERSAAALAPLLVEPAMSAHARLALEGVPGAVPDLALIAALGQTDGDVRRGIIASLAARRAGVAFAPLTELATRGDEATATTALHALGAVARDARDASMIAALPLGDTEALLVAQQHAFFTALAHLANQGVNLDDVVIPFPKMQARTAEVADLAVVVLLRINPAQAVPQIVALLQSGDPDNLRRAGSAIVGLPDAAARQALVARAAEVPAAAWPLLVESLNDHGGAEILPLVRSALGAEDEATRLAALTALGRVGEAGDVVELLQLAAADGPIGRAARAALGSLPDTDADPLLLTEFGRAESPLRLVLPDIFVARAMRGAVSKLLEVAASAERRLAGECYGAAGALGDVSMMPMLWERWSAAAPAQRPAVERALVAIARGSAEGVGTHAITARWPEGDEATRTAIRRMLVGVGDIAAAGFLGEQAAATPPDAAAVPALASWRSMIALPVLEKLIQGGKLSPELRTVAWNGMFDIARNRMSTDQWDAFNGLRRSLEATTDLEEQRRIVDFVSTGNRLFWAEQLDKWADFEGIGPEAKAAAAALRHRLGED